MAVYVYQTFTSQQILTGAQAQQCEVNIQTHQHGVGSVQAIGLAWPVGSLTASRGISADDNNLMFECYGDLNASFFPAAQLSSLFSATFVNCASGRVALLAAPGEFIGPSSQFVLTPKASVNVYCAGKSPLGLFGQTVGPFTLADFYFSVSSMQSADVPYLFPGDFDFYHLIISDVVMGTPDVPCLYLSIDSLSSLLIGGMRNTIGAGSSAILFDTVTMQSNQFLMAKVFFSNPANSGAAIYFDVERRRRTGTTGLNPAEITNNTGAASLAGILNGIRFSTESGGFNSTTGHIEFYGWRY